MLTKEISEAAVEFRCVLENSTQDIIKKIPKKFTDFLKSIESKTYKFEYDKTKKLNEQNLKQETKGIIALVYENYICSEEEKEEYLKKRKEIFEKNEAIKREKYSTDNIFNKKVKQNEEKVELIEHKHSTFFSRILNKLKRIFKK